jgi:hypothetical protein
VQWDAKQRRATLSIWRQAFKTRRTKAGTSSFPLFCRKVLAHAHKSSRTWKKSLLSACLKPDAHV